MVNKMAFKFLLNVFETILGLDLENSSSKANCRTVTPVGLGVPENQRNLQTRNIRTTLETLNNHNVRLN